MIEASEVPLMSCAEEADVGGSDSRSACGTMMWRNCCQAERPRQAPASHCACFTASSPPRQISPRKAAV